MADDTVAVADALGWDRAHVVGFSMGGTIAQTLAIRHTTRVRTLTSISSGPSPRLTRPTLKLTRAVARSARRTPRNRAEHEDFIAELYNMFRSPGFPSDEAWRRQVAREEDDRAYDPDGHDAKRRRFLRPVTE
jgi:pimeloyl-ACP methyl ester carboxylesterase